jgi:hypothetical protein
MSMGFEGNELGRIDPRALEDKGDLLSPREMSRYEGELARLFSAQTSSSISCFTRR